MTGDRAPSRPGEDGSGGEGSPTGERRRFPRPPVRFRDAKGRPARILEYDGAFGDLYAMYEGYAPEDRAQGIPPARPEQLREWLEEITAAGHNVTARQDGEVVGHACLIPDRSGSRSCELAIFVLRGHQHAGIGTELLKALLGLGEARGIETVWLTVERWNAVAVHLYRKAGFVTRDTRGFELEMALELD